MRVEVIEEPMAALAQSADIPIAFEVRSIFHVADPCDGLGESLITERRLDVPYLKDYDAINGENPAEWSTRFDVSNWSVFAARAEGRRVGAAVVALTTPGLDRLEDSRGVAILWDIRVAPEARGKGVGSALFRAAEAWAGARGCRQLKVETQNINVPACRFYARQGCILTAVNRFAYPEFPEEIQLIWQKDLSASAFDESRQV